MLQHQSNTKLFYSDIVKMLHPTFRFYSRNFTFTLKDLHRFNIDWSSLRNFMNLLKKSDFIYVVNVLRLCSVFMT